MRYIQEYDFKGKKALIRVDFNVPLDDRFGIVDDTRIQGTIPTIRQVLDKGGSAILLSHLGRPRRGYEEKFSLRHLVPYLSRILGAQVTFASSCTGTETQAQVHQLGEGEVLLLENIRFQAGETTGDLGLAQALAAWGDVYINDAFGTAHRLHTSTTLLAHCFKDRLAGFLMQKELKNADRILRKAKRPFVAIVGGAKISDKIQPLKRLLDQLDYLLVGGGVANTFQKALGGQLGDSLLESDQVELARQLIEQAQQNKVALVMPVDMVVSPRLEDAAPKKTVAGGSVPPGPARIYSYCAGCSNNFVVWPHRFF
jgi:phosphoglycerate kinase